MTNAPRPERLDEFVGQESARRIIAVLVAAARMRNEAVPHLLMSGPPGLGKTSLARIIANETGGHLVEVIGSAVRNPHEMTQHLMRLKAHDVLFIDEVHALGRHNEEVLYGAMEDATVVADQVGFNDLMKQIGIRSGEKSKVTHKLPAFTLIAATTLLGRCSSPLRSRFRQVLELKPYSNEELQTIVRSAGTRIGFEMDPGFALEIARRSRGTARIAINNMLWFRDVVHGSGGAATTELLNTAFHMRGTDENGLTNNDREYLGWLVESTEPVGVETLASALGESVETLEQSIEPFLLQQGYINRTPRGRVATDRARQLFQEATK